MKTIQLFSLILLTAGAAMAAPTITTQPNNVSAGPGERVNVTVMGTSADISSLSARIEFSGGGSGTITTEISGDNNNYTATLGFQMNKTLDGETFIIVVSDSSGSVDSARRTLTMVLPDLSIVRFNQIPTPPGSTFTLALRFASGQSLPVQQDDYDFRWTLDGTEVGTDHFYTDTGSASSEGNYRVVYNFKGQTKTRTTEPIFVYVNKFWADNSADYTQANRQLRSPDLGLIAIRRTDNWAYLAGSDGSTNGFGWMYISSSSPASTWFYDNGLGWCWAQLNSPSTRGASTWPSFYNQTRNAWLVYQQDSNPRRFYNTATRKFIEIPNQ